MIDYVVIMVKSGSGGSGAISFRREKFVPFGGPDGGDGGDGGSVIVKADASVTDLRQFQRKRHYLAEDGGSGRGKNKHGRRGKDRVLLVPVGTVVSYQNVVDGDAFIADLEVSGQQVVVAEGGKGGWGNTHYACSTDQAPEFAQKGEPGDENSIILEMRLIADVGIIGLPNAGKSTLLAAASAAKPKIASYPFTTLEPVLGVVEIGQQRFVLAEIPGLIEDAHIGRGLGHDFLRHILRTRMLLHLIDGGSLKPLDEMDRVNEEITLYDSALVRKPQLVAVNKIDLPHVRSRLTMIKQDFNNAGVDVHFISATTGEGVTELVKSVGNRLEELKARREAAEPAVARKVFQPRPKVDGISVHRDGDTYVVAAPGLERLTTRGGTSGAELRWQLKRYLTRLGVNRALERAGVRSGDKVRCGSLEWEWP